MNLHSSSAFSSPVTKLHEQKLSLPWELSPHQRWYIQAKSGPASPRPLVFLALGQLSRDRVYLDDGCDDTCNDAGGGAESREVIHQIRISLASRADHRAGWQTSQNARRDSNGSTSWKGTHSLHRWARY